MIGGQDGAILPDRDFSLGPARSKIIFWCFILYNPLLTKLVQSRRLDIGLVQDSVLVLKTAKGKIIMIIIMLMMMIHDNDIKSTILKYGKRYPQKNEGFVITKCSL